MSDQITVKKAEAIQVDDYRYVIEASQIGLRPGVRRPDILTTDLGNGCCFKFESDDKQGLEDGIDEVTGWHYRQLNSPNTLLVING